MEFINTQILQLQTENPEVLYTLLGIGLFLGLLAGTILFLILRQNAMKSLATETERAAQYHAMADQLTAENKELEEEVRRARELSIRLQVERDAFEKQMDQAKQDMQKNEEIMINKFENLSNRIFEQKTQAFKQQSADSLGVLLNPLREKITDFEKRVEQSFSDQTKENFSLKEQIKNIVDMNEKMTLQAENLANALKGDSKAQGDWGEIILEKILEDSGLRKDVDYMVQGGGMNLRDSETGALQKPDVIIRLPEDKHVIIDSKVSLTHYERYFSEADDEQKQLHLKQFQASVKKHINDLEQRRYQDTEKLGTPDFVLMFIPIEAAYVLAVQQDRDLHNFAWGKKVVLVCPTTLFATLKTVASVWRLELQNKNALEIAQQGGALYDKIEGFVKEMEVIGKHISNADKAYDSAMKKLSQGRGNILGRTEKLRELGAKASKELPRELLEDSGSIDDESHSILNYQREQASG